VQADLNTGFIAAIASNKVDFYKLSDRIDRLGDKLDVINRNLAANTGER
jgi:hypothetical protein